MLILEQLHHFPMEITVFHLLNPFVLIPLLIIILLLVIKYWRYISSSYYQVTKLPLFSVRGDKGRYGEYLIYERLKRFEKEGAKFLFNLYIPKENGETTEIDVLMICSKGIFVFESKNYSGWIFGSENQRYWYQTLPKGRGNSQKDRFYNPIIQNQSHIKHLKALLGEKLPIRSIIVFSDRCTLKSVHLRSYDIEVIYRYDVVRVVKKWCGQMSDVCLSKGDIANLYDKLYPYTQVDEFTKVKHIANIHANQEHRSGWQTAPLADISCEETSEEGESETVDIEDTTPMQPEETKTAPETQSAEVQAPNPVKSEPDKLMNDEPPILKCPKCGGNLILRTATRGANKGKQFYGCSNFPKCKYVKNLE